MLISMASKQAVILYIRGERKSNMFVLYMRRLPPTSWTGAHTLLKQIGYGTLHNFTVWQFDVKCYNILYIFISRPCVKYLFSLHTDLIYIFYYSIFWWVWAKKWMMW